MDAKPRSDGTEFLGEAGQFVMVTGASVLVLLLMPMFQRPRETAGAPASRRISRAAVYITGMDARPSPLERQSAGRAASPREEPCPCEPRN